MRGRGVAKSGGSFRQQLPVVTLAESVVILHDGPASQTHSRQHPDTFITAADPVAPVTLRRIQFPIPVGMMAGIAQNADIRLPDILL
jgi:hypothetical protein